MYIVGGLISFGLGALGVVLPVLPTTPFLLLASFCFVRGSERFDKWFRSTKLYKNNLESFVTDRAMTFRQKQGLMIFSDFMMMFPIVILDSIPIKVFVICMMIFKHYYFTFKIKTIKVEKEVLKEIV
jgi:uncharacterized membrane protein YbaN (DUF454 family)